MGLQDVPPFMIDSPYPFGSPEYQAAILPMLEQQLQAEAQRAANARGVMYSGPAMADEQQAAALLAYQMAQQGAQQSESEKLTSEQQQFQQQMQQEQEQAAQRLAEEQNAAGIKSSAIGGGTNALGTMLALHYMMPGGGPGGAAKPSLWNDLTTSPHPDAAPIADELSAAPGWSSMGPGSPLAPSGPALWNTPAALDQPGWSVAGPGSSPSMVTDSLAGSEAPAAAPGFFAMHPELTSGMNLGAGALGGLLGYKLMPNHDSTASKIGGGLGGLMGYGLGAEYGPLGSFVGSGLGSFLGGLL